MDIHRGHPFNRQCIGNFNLCLSVIIRTTPFIYYGEEIGMGGSKPDENIRRPMQWDNTANAGFTTGKPWRSPDANFTDINVSSQTKDIDSLLSNYRELIHLREIHPVLQTGQYIAVDCNNPAVYAALRVDEKEIVLVLINLDKETITNYELDAANTTLLDKTYNADVLLGSGQAQGLSVTNSGFSNYTPVDELPAYSTTIIKIQP